jgi:ElaB/YqjD/DUF883 family membrane-anchored ribosome-binding protein
MADSLAERGERLGEKIDHLSGSARDMVTRGRERAQIWGEDVGHYVQDQPVKSLLIAAGIGLCLGAFLTRR